MQTQLRLHGGSMNRTPERRAFIIAGPCSAETETQVMESAKALAKLRTVHALRAGIWKPRTRPNAFEGIGMIGLEWLKSARAATGLPIAVEVANVKHVYDALKTGVDILWIGARTTANPFSVQEIADALTGVNVPVLVKNPVTPDIDLWFGALERLNLAGVTDLAAVHRGFPTHVPSKYRNDPLWTIPLEMKRRCPDLPMLCDPSHICGKTELIFEISQRAMDLNFDGLMVESHINPDQAWSDAGQQLRPHELCALLDRLRVREASVNDLETQNKLEYLREKIDRIDDEILDFLAQRMNVAEEIGLCKQEKNISIFQPGRWDEIVRSRARAGAEKNLSKEFILNLLDIIHQESIHHQSRVMHREASAEDAHLRASIGEE